MEGGRDGQGRKLHTQTHAQHMHVHLHAPAHHSHTRTHTRTRTLTLTLTITHTHTHTHTHTQEEKVKELHEAILPPLLRQLNHMVESNNFAKGWIWGDKVYDRERGGVGVGGKYHRNDNSMCKLSNANYTSITRHKHFYQKYFSHIK